jgi:hypothetical protein
VKGKWGRKGCTSVNLKTAKKESLRKALAAAWELYAPREARATKASATAQQGELPNATVSRNKTL